MPKFEVGDKVRCVNDGYVAGGLRCGGFYTVKAVKRNNLAEDYVWLYETGNEAHFASRFVLANQTPPPNVTPLSSAKKWGQRGNVQIFRN